MFADPSLARGLQSGTITKTAIDRFSIVLMGGIAAEAIKYGRAEGGASDESMLIEIMTSIQPPLSYVLIRQQARWAAVQVRTPCSLFAFILCGSSGFAFMLLQQYCAKRRCDWLDSHVHFQAACFVLQQQQHTHCSEEGQPAQQIFTSHLKLPACCICASTHTYTLLSNAEATKTHTGFCPVSLFLSLLRVFTICFLLLLHTSKCVHHMF